LNSNKGTVHSVTNHEIVFTARRYASASVSRHRETSVRLSAQSDPPFRKSRFRHISLNSASAVKASEKVQLSLIGSRQCAFHRAIDEHCALSLSPQRVAQNENFYVFLHSFHIFVAGYCRHFKFAMQIHHSKSQHTDDKLSLKWAWSRHVIHF